MKKNNFIYNYIIKNKKVFIILSFLFIIGITLGVIRINLASKEKIQNITEYVESLVENIKKNNTINYSKLINSIKQNIKNIGILGLLGCTIVGSSLIYIVIVYQGFKLRLYNIIIYKSSRNEKRNNVFYIFFAIAKYDLYTDFIFMCRKWNKIMQKYT